MTDPTPTEPTPVPGDRAHFELPDGYWEWDEARQREFVREVINALRPPG